MKGFFEISPSDAPKWLPLPVVIVSAGDGKRKNGMSAAWISQVSAEPPIIMVAIRESRYTWEIIKDVEFFGISVLGVGQERLAEFFGTVSGREVDKFSETGIEPSMYGDVPLIPGSPCSFVCRKKDTFTVGDHIALFGEVVKAWEGEDRKPLIWHRWKIEGS